MSRNSLVYSLFLVSNEDFIKTAYHILLNRSPDEEGNLYYMARLARGFSRESILLQLSKSPECRAALPQSLSSILSSYEREHHWFWRLFNRHSSQSRTLRQFAYDLRTPLAISPPSAPATEMANTPTEQQRAPAVDLSVQSATRTRAECKSTFGEVNYPLFSFVIPVYDRTDLLRNCINSALAQTITDFEVIVVMDGSPAETIAVVEEFRHDPRVRAFSYPTSSGNAVRGRNKGIIEARGKYISFLDSDDIAATCRLELCMPFLEEDLADVIYGSWRASLDGSRKVAGIENGQVIESPSCDLEMLKEICVPCQSTVTVRRDLLRRVGLLDPEMKYREDHELWLRLAHHGARFHSIPEVLCTLRLHQGNNELNFVQQDEDWAKRAIEVYAQPKISPRKVVFILPGLGISGGIAVVLKHASMLIAAGQDVLVINVGPEANLDWLGVNTVPIVQATDARRYLFENIDCLFATGWQTAEWLDKFDAKQKYYFVQSDERRFTDDPETRKEIESTYRRSCRYLTEAFWIRDLLKTEFGHDAAYVPNGIDLSIFRPLPPIARKGPKKLRVLLEGPIAIPFKGMADSYRAVCDLDVEIWIVSSAGKPPADWRYDRFFEGVAFNEMPKIYSSCDIFLKMSRVEGFFGPPMEAMACGCAVVVGKVSGYSEYIVHEMNALVVESGDVAGAKESVRRLIFDKSLRTALINGGLKTVKDWSWEKSHRAMLGVIRE